MYKQYFRTSDRSTGMPGTYMLAEELILHFAPVVFKGYKIKSKSLLRITRNADIDADALYDEDLDYRRIHGRSDQTA